MHAMMRVQAAVVLFCATSFLFSAQGAGLTAPSFWPWPAYVLSGNLTLSISADFTIACGASEALRESPVLCSPDSLVAADETSPFCSDLLEEGLNRARREVRWRK